jgi:hypothetical protein
VYDYPLLRHSQNKLQTYGHPIDATYAFRFNETTHIYFEVGSNFMTDHIQLRWASEVSIGIG